MSWGPPAIGLPPNNSRLISIALAQCPYIYHRDIGNSFRPFCHYFGGKPTRIIF